jgi:hypothetical protein
MNANFQTMLNANSKEMNSNFQAMLNTNSKEMNANFQAMLNTNSKEMNANSKEINANFQAMLNANSKEMNANFQAMLNAKPSGSSSSIPYEACIAVAGVAFAVVFAISQLQERNFDRTTAEITPINDKIQLIQVDSATTKEQNTQMKEQITRINERVTQIQVDFATTKEQIIAINVMNGNILDAINKLQPPRK